MKIFMLLFIVSVANASVNVGDPITADLFNLKKQKIEYSNNVEINTGDTFDGKPIYTKALFFNGSVPLYESSSLAALTGIESIIELEYTFKMNSGSTVVTIGHGKYMSSSNCELYLVPDGVDSETKHIVTYYTGSWGCHDFQAIIKYTKVNNDPWVGVIPGGLILSSDFNQKRERESYLSRVESTTGDFWNSKPIYQRSFIQLGTTPTLETTIDTITDVDTVIDIDYSYKLYDTDSFITIGHSKFYATSNYCELYLRNDQQDSTTKYMQYSCLGWTTKDWKGIIRYTKSTD